MISNNMMLLTKEGYNCLEDLAETTESYIYDSKTYDTKIEKQGRINMYSINTSCVDELICDANNRFLTKRFHPVTQNTWKPLLWITQEDYIAVPINKNNTFPKMKKHKKIFEDWFEDKKFWDFVGYILDNFEMNGNRIYIKNTRDSKYKLHELKWDYKILKSTNKIVITSPALAYFLDFFSKEGHKFVLPNFVIDLPKNILTILLRYILRDAPSLNSEYQLYQHTDKKTIYYLATCVAKLYNTIYLINNNTVVNQRETFSLTYSKTIKSNSYGIYKDDILWYRVHSITQKPKMEVAYKIKNALDRVVINGVLLSI